MELRLLPTGDPDERYTLELEPGKAVPSLNIPQFRAPFCVRSLGCLLFPVTQHIAHLPSRHQ